MQKERWDQIESILDTALTLSGGDRKSYVSEACGDDEELLQEVYELLEAVERSEETQFLEKISQENKALLHEFSASPFQSPQDLIGSRIGVFRLSELLGAGGMGAVYKAERDDGQFSQRVAIKLLQQGIQSQETLQRFRLEQGILAALHHPNIAQLYDGGITESGLPYLIMEYVDGVPIDQYCNDQRLTVDDRIILFKEVCKAVQFAHTNLVIHRDLKAQNIYVTADGMVKVLDFGIAKLLDPKLTEKTLIQTRAGQKFWTPQYAAPEQVSGHPITTATDVYALGVLLHKLLTGTYPLAFNDKSLKEVEKAIMEDNPIAASRTIKQSDQSDKETTNRKTNRAELIKKLSGDLDALILKALRKEAEYRYNSVGQLIEDLERFQNGLPLIARKDTISYRVGKFFRRYRAGFAVSVIIFLIIAGLTGFYTWRITEEKEIAQTEAQKAEKTTQFLTNLFAQSNPEKAQKADMTAREILDAGAESIFNELRDQPEVRGRVLSVIGQAYLNVELFKKADSLVSDALQIYRKQDNNQLAGDKANAQLVMAQIKSDLGNYEEAEALARSALETYKKVSGPDAMETKKSLLVLSIILHYNEKYEEGMIKKDEWASKSPETDKKELANQLIDEGQMASAIGDMETAMAKTREALELRREIYGEFHAFTAIPMQRLSSILIDGDNYSKEAEKLQKKGLEIIEIVYDEPHTEWAYALYTLAVIYRLRGNYQEANKLYQEAIVMMENVRGDKDPYTLNFKLKYAQFLLETYKLATAKDIFQKLENIYTKLYGREFLFSIQCRAQLALILKKKGKLNEAAKLYSQVIKEYKNREGSRHADGILVRPYYGHLLLQLDKKEEAEKWIVESINLLENAKTNKKWKLAVAEQTLGLLRMEQMHFEEAERLLKGSYDFFDRTRGPKSNITKEALEYLINLYQKWDKSDKVNEYKSMLTKTS